MTPLHPETVNALNAVLAPIVLVVVTLASACIITALAYRVWQWLKARRVKTGLTEFNHGWGRNHDQ
jgi:phage-related minor tail protein